MISPVAFLEALGKRGMVFYTGVPDSLLKSLIAAINHTVDEGNHIGTANEGAAVALASGYHLATGKIPLVYMQNSGTGNAINPLLSLSDPLVYSIPMLLLIGWRGEPGRSDEPQHKKQGLVQEDLLKALGYPYEILESDETHLNGQLDRIVKNIQHTNGPAILLVRKDTFGEYKPKSTGKVDAGTYALSRESAIKIVLEALPSDVHIVSTTGMASRELYELRESLGQSHEKDFLTVGSMGHSIMIALGLALFGKSGAKKRILCLDGDGAALMHMGSIPVAADRAPKGFIHVILNNGAHDSVGGQPTIGLKLSFEKIALACGYKEAYTVTNTHELKSVMERLTPDKGPALVEVRIAKGARVNLGRPKTSPLDNKHGFMQSLGKV